MIKLKTQSSKVLGVSFHGKHPWILTGLNCGQIQLWNYQTGILIKSFSKNAKAVHCVNFHRSRQIFVSGGIDQAVRVWNLDTDKFLYSLRGHHGCVRSAQFHCQLPWVLSSSDDKTIRIWNWQSRTCIAELIGHKGAVMCASFHPKEDILVSASLDNTVRGWGFGSLKQNTDGIKKLRHMVVFEGHIQGVNWASFHPEDDVIISASMDKTVRIWDIWNLKNKAVNWDSSHPTRPLVVSETKAWKVKTLLGHTDSVSSVMFHAKLDIIVTISEDKTIRVWSANKLTGVWSSGLQDDRFWSLAVHPEMKILAAGHDTGMIVVKLESDRLAFGLTGESLVYTKQRHLWCYNFQDGSSVKLNVNWPSQGSGTFSLSPKKDNGLLVCFGGSYQLYTRQKSKISYHRYFVVNESCMGKGDSVVFISPTRFAVLLKDTSQLIVKNLRNEVVNESVLPVGKGAISYAGTSNLLWRSDKKVVMLDVEQEGGVILCELQTPSVKYSVWSNDMVNVALLSKDSVIIASKNLQVLCILRERLRVKSGAWDDNGVFIYSTRGHIKFCLPNGDSGIIQTLDTPIYIIKIAGKRIFHLDRHGTVRSITIDPSEYIFKLSVLRKGDDQVMRMIKNSQLCRQAMTCYLQQKGFPEVDLLHCVEDEKTRFNMALESGNIRAAVESATKIDEKHYWSRLGVDALRQGNVETAKLAYEKTENFVRLSFLHLITGNADKLSKLIKVAEGKTNIMGQFQNALFLGDVRERVKILENAGHLPLAYVTAVVHGLNDTAERLATELGDNVPSLPEGKSPRLLIPPLPVMCGGDWPVTPKSDCE